MKTVLMIENEAHIQEMLTFFLEAEGYHAVSLSDCHQVLDYIASDKSMELVLLDWMLPYGSGLQVLKTLKKHPKHQKYRSLC